MKKHILSIAVVVTVVATIMGLNFKQNSAVPEKGNKEVFLKIGEQEVKATYEDLGLTSVFSADNQKQEDISVDKKLLAHKIITIFSFLNLPEDAHKTSFITSENQKVEKTFNLRKLIEQLKENAKNKDNSTIEVEVINEDLETKKKELAKKEVVMKLEGEDVQTIEWKIPANVALDKTKLKTFIENEIAKKVNRPTKNASIKKIEDQGKAIRVEVDGLAQNGVTIPVEKNIEVIQNAVLAGTFEIFIQLQFEPSYVYNETDVDIGKMELLSTGHSNFAGSPEGRAFNIRKGLNEKMNNIMIPPGAKFSFNSFVGPISGSAGWQKALGIFNGGDLIPTLGGGLCQVSTTIYRAALLAGLQITERRPHSLYVTYYKKFGEGLDATVFSTGPDLVFTNDTSSYIFIQSYVEGDDAYVKVYGTPDGRISTLQGPYLSHNIPKEKNYKPPVNEIVWFRNIDWPNGKNVNEMITSRYRVIPKHPAQ